MWFLLSQLSVGRGVINQLMEEIQSTESGRQKLFPIVQIPQVLSECLYLKGYVYTLNIFKEKNKISAFQYFRKFFQVAMCRLYCNRDWRQNRQEAFVVTYPQDEKTRFWDLIRKETMSLSYSEGRMKNSLVSDFINGSYRDWSQQWS